MPTNRQLKKFLHAQYPGHRIERAYVVEVEGSDGVDSERVGGIDFALVNIKTGEYLGDYGIPQNAAIALAAEEQLHDPNAKVRVVRHHLF